MEAGGPTSTALPIGGLLWLPAIGLLAAAGRALFGSAMSLGSLLELQRLGAASSAPGLSRSSLSLRTVYIGSFRLALFVALAWLGIRFFHRKRNVPMLMIGLLVLDLAGVVGLYALGRGRTLGFSTVTGTIGAVAIWVPYFLVSVRVKRTFIL